MKTYTIYGTSDIKAFVEKYWRPVATVLAKSKEEALREFKHCKGRRTDADSDTVTFTCDAPNYASYRVKREH